MLIFLSRRTISIETSYEQGYRRPSNERGSPSQSLRERRSGCFNDQQARAPAAQKQRLPALLSLLATRYLYAC